MALRLGGTLTALIAGFATWSSAQVPPAVDTYGITPQQFWRTAFGIGSWIPLAGDANGDGRADLLAIGPGPETRIELARTSDLGKSVPSNVARDSFGSGMVAAASGRFFPGSLAAGVLIVMADGTVQMAWGMLPNGNNYSHLDPAGLIHPDDVPRSPCRTVAADFNGDGKLDVLVLDRGGKLLLLMNAIGADGRPQFKPNPQPSALLGVRQFAAGSFAGKKQASVVWLDTGGTLWRNNFEFKQGGLPRLGQAQSLTRVSTEDRLAVGRFRGGKFEDILIGQRLFAEGNPQKAVTLEGIPTTEAAKYDEHWIASDIDGNGKDDLIRHRLGMERFGRDDVQIHFSYDAKDKAKGYYCSANDGLPDFWKMGLIKPGGVDLVALGCKVGRRDIIVEIERFDNEPLDRLKANMDRVVKYYASLPIQNPDGTTGIAMHLIYKDPWPLAKKDEVWAKFNEYFPAVERRGVVHSAFTMSGGPLVSQINGHNMHTNEGWAEFLHEFGHQLDLRHDGFYPATSPGFPSDTGCALYPSLMSYSYSYSVGDNRDAIGYSDGSLASFKVDQRKLSEKLPFPFDKVKFLGGGPYRFKVKPSEDGKSAVVDWNWNGIFGEDEVVADITYGHGADFGPQFQIAKTQVAPCVIAHGDGDPRPLVVYAQSGALGAKSWVGEDRDRHPDRWSVEAADLRADVTGDPTGAYLSDNTTWIAYPTTKGVVLRSVQIAEQGKPVFGQPDLVPGTQGVQPTLTVMNKKLVLLLWRGKNVPIGIRMVTASEKGLRLAGERTLDFMSDVPVGAVAGPITPNGPSLWIGRMQKQGGDNAGRSEVVRYEFSESGSSRAGHRMWLAGRYSYHRATLLWRQEAGLLPEGRIYQLTGGLDPPGVAKQQWIGMNVPYGDVGEGWLDRRYQPGGFTSPSAPGAIFFQNDILYAYRRSDNDGLCVAFYGSGATTRPLGDFDDIGHLRDYGLSHSIPFVSK